MDIVLIKLHHQAKLSAIRELIRKYKKKDRKIMRKLMKMKRDEEDFLKTH